MAEASWLERNGVTPGKLILIIVLGFVLAGVVIYQCVALMGSGESAGEGLASRRRGGVATARDATSRTRPTAGSKASNNNPRAELSRTTNDHSMAGEAVTLPLAVVLRHNPFRLPEPLRLPPPIVAAPPSEQSPSVTDTAEDDGTEGNGEADTKTNVGESVEGNRNVVETDPVDEERLRELEQQRMEAEQARLAAATERAAAADRLKTIGVAVVLTSGREAMAAIGQEFVRVGDVIDGWEVVSIKDNGSVVLKPAD